LSIPRRRALRRYGEEADTRRACPPPPLPAFRPSRDFDVLELRRDCHAYVLSSFQRTGRDPERPRPRMLVAPHPAGSLPANPTCRPFLGEPFNLTKTNHALSSAFWVSTACRFATSTHRVASRDGVRKRWLVVLSVCPTWEPGTGPAWGRTPKAKFHITRRGLACQPLSGDSLSKIPARELSPLSPATPYPGALPRVRCLTYGRSTCTRHS
jgi:hypothetical protein